MVDRLNTLVLDLYTRLRREEGQGTVEYAVVLAFVVGLGTVIAALSSSGISAAVTDLASKISKI
jgi:hypothetical protein